MAGFGMQLWGIVQDLSQLEGIYDKGWETFVGNSGVLQYFGSRDQRTAEYFSKLCGVTTMEKFSFSNAIASVFSSTSGQGAGNSTSGTTTTSTSTRDVVQRHLAYPDELMVMRGGREAGAGREFNPIRGYRVRWHDDQKLKKLGVNLREGVVIPFPARAPALVAAVFPPLRVRWPPCPLRPRCPRQRRRPCFARSAGRNFPRPPVRSAAPGASAIAPETRRGHSVQRSWS